MTINMSGKPILKTSDEKNHNGAKPSLQYFIILEIQSTYDTADGAKKFFYDIKGERLMILKKKVEERYFLALPKIYTEQESSRILTEIIEGGFSGAFRLSVTEAELV